MNPDIRPWKLGDRFSAGHLNEVVDVARRVNAMTGPGITQMLNGTAFEDEFDPNIVGWRMGIIQSGTYTDERYKVKFARISTGTKTTDQIAFAAVTTPRYDQATNNSLDYPITATNLAELAGHSHILLADTIVQLFALYDRQKPARLHWFFNQVASTGVIFRVNLTKTSGSNGTQSSAASWVYTAKTLDNATTLGTGLSPEETRPFGTRSFAVRGTGYYDLTGTFVLYSVDEPYGTGHC